MNNLIKSAVLLLALLTGAPELLADGAGVRFPMEFSDISGARAGSVQISTNRVWRAGDKQSLPLPWPESWCARGQCFNPFKFAQNSAVLRGEVERGLKVSDISHLIAELDRLAVAQFDYTPNGNPIIRHDFDYVFDEGGESEARLQSGWYGAFGNALVAQGYLHLWKITGERLYYFRASRLLRAITDTSLPQELRLHSIGKFGQVWYLGYVSDAAKVKVFNEHNHVLFAMQQYRNETGDPGFDKQLSAGITTVAIDFHSQFTDTHFVYGPDTRHRPDYGQARAGWQYEMLCQLSSHPTICSLRDRAEQLLAAQR